MSAREVGPVARWLLGVTTVIAALSPSDAGADRLVPGPGEAGHDEMLARRADAFDVQIHEIMTPSVGWGLEAFVSRPENRALIDDFFARGGRDFRAETGRHPYEVVDYYEEHGDLGMFGGVQAAGDAFRYVVLRDSGAPAEELERARRALLRAMDGLHWYTRVTGQPGVFARGIRRITPEAGEPPLPGDLPELVPLRDGSGNPLPVDKHAVWRADQSGELPFLIWLDDTSKDQAAGYVMALGAVYDAVVDDPSVPTELVNRLVEDARAIGLSLLETRDIGASRTTELVIMDADGRPTTFHDLSAEEVAPGLVLRDATNGFNGWMGLAILRTLFHITGDERIGRFYYEELIGRRGYLDNVEATINAMYLGRMTNYSNVNMAFVSAYGLLRYESDRDIGIRLRVILENKLYAVGVDRDADDLGQSFFDFVYAGFRVLGTMGEGTDAREDGIRTLVEHPSPPHWDRTRVNCDEAELAALRCTLDDGTVVTLLEGGGRGGQAVASEAIPMRLRPPSNFEWRSDPHRVNGGGGERLNPGGDFHGAYWLGRFLTAGTDGFANVSPRARPAPPRSPDPPDGGPPPSGDSGPPPIDGGAP
ncbi:MAG: hypothetical protein IT379_30990, partial [Deltaproteobacteria bacterium]|nr:hypothetical protein [Deltaproteobacteria bacterium]